MVDPLHASGAVYAVLVTYLGAIFIKKAWQLLKDPSNKDVARSLFKYSIYYMMLLCLVMVVDSLPFTHGITTALGDNLQTFIGSAMAMLS